MIDRVPLREKANTINIEKNASNDGKGIQLGSKRKLECIQNSVSNDTTCDVMKSQTPLMIKKAHDDDDAKSCNIENIEVNSVQSHSIATLIHNRGLLGSPGFFSPPPKPSCMKIRLKSSRKKTLPSSSAKKKLSRSTPGKSSGKLTPPRHLNFGCERTPQRKGCEFSLTLSSNFANANQFEIRTSECDPSPFQIEIPTHESVLVSCKVCSIMDNYVDMGGADFDFTSIMPWKLNFHQLPDSVITQANDDTSNKGDRIHSYLREIVDDVVVEGFFREYYDDSNRGTGFGRIEALVLGSNKLRKFFVCFRGSSDLHEKPVDVNARMIDYDKADTTSFYDINSNILSVYNKVLEENVFILLHRLSCLKPFCDIVMTGHSFGGAIAHVAAAKYASQRSADRVSCHVFGCPMISGIRFRNHVHSLPNLNIIRVERNTDPFISLPEGPSWIHTGHTIRMTTNTTISMVTEQRSVEVKAYRYDKNKPTPSFVQNKVCTIANLTKKKIGNEIKSYLKDLEKIASLKSPWVTSFSGEEGKGVYGKEQEERFVV